MILLLHIAVAIGLLLVTSLAWLYPTNLKLKTSYLLASATLLSGTFIVLTQHVNLLHVCTSGLLYLSVVSLDIFAAKARLAQNTAKK